MSTEYMTCNMMMKRMIHILMYPRVTYNRNTCIHKLMVMNYQVENVKCNRNGIAHITHEIGPSSQLLMSCCCWLITRAEKLGHESHEKNGDGDNK